MLQNKFEMPLGLDPGLKINNTSLYYIYLGSLFLCSLISILVLSSLAMSLQLLLFIALLVMTFFILKTEKNNQVTAIKLNKDDDWEISINHSGFVSAELIGECIVTYFVVWLNFSTMDKNGKKKTFHLLLLPNSADKELLRRLRVRLRFLKNKTDDVEAYR